MWTLIFMANVLETLANMKNCLTTSGVGMKC